MSQSFTKRVSHISNIAELESMLVDETGDHNRQDIIQARVDSVRRRNRINREDWKRRNGYLVGADDRARD